MVVVKDAKAWREFKYGFEREDVMCEHEGEPTSFPCFVFTRFVSTEQFNATSRVHYEHEFIYKEDFVKLQ